MKVIAMLAAICMAALLLPQAQAAISLGSATSSREAVAQPGDRVEFGMLLFNMHENLTLRASVRVEGPDSWNAYANPGSFDLKFSQPGSCRQMDGYECLSTGLGDVMARKVAVVAQVPKSAKPGEYIVKAETRIGGDGGQISMQQSRTFYFSVLVREAVARSQAPSSDSTGGVGSGSASPGTEDMPAGNGSANNTQQEPNAMNEGITGLLTWNIAGIGILLLSMIAALALSWRIYRRD